MPPISRTPLTPVAGPRRDQSLTFVVATILGLALVVSCGFQSATPSPTPTVVATAAPRPSPEPAAAVGGWYAEAQSEAPVRIWADLTAGEVDAITKVLQQRYPKLSVEWRRGLDLEHYQQTLLDVRGGAPAWDVYIGDRGPLLRASSLALRWTPPESRNVHAALADAEGAWYGIASTYHVVQYNTDQVRPPNIPTSFEALLNPGFYGRLAIEDLSLTWLRGLVEIRGREGAAELIRGLAQQSVTFRQEPRTVVAFVTSGQQGIAIDARLDAVERERRAGGKIAWIGTDPVIAQPLGMVVSARTDRPNGSRLVANLLLARDTQSVLAHHGRIPSRLDVDTEPVTLARGLRPHVTMPPDGRAEAELRDLWRELWGRR